MVELQEFDEFRAPRRWPWFLLLLVLIGGGVWWAKREKPERPAIVTVTPEAVEDPDRPLAATAAAAGPRVAPIADMDASVLFSEGKAAEARDDLLEARKKYLELLRRGITGDLRRDVENRLGRINVELVTTPRKMPEKVEYTIKRGDILGKVARDFGTTVELIQRSNNITNPNRVRVGDRLWILKGTFRILVRKSRNDLTLFLNDEFFKRYSVGTGKDGSTPVGTFKISQKIEEPDWWRPDGKQVTYGDPENILGTRWMALRATGSTPDLRSYGIHGTWDESSIGHAESAGCVRMRNREVEELYLLLPTGAAVEIGE